MAAAVIVAWPLLLAAAIVFGAAALVSPAPAHADFKQQGPKLVGSGGVGLTGQGRSVAVSADGNTAIIGGIGDNNSVGAAWVFTRSGGVWTQEGAKLVGNDAVGAALQGFAVAISADGNTAIVGGRNDNSNAGAAWVYIRSGGVWTQQGPKLIGTGTMSDGNRGESVALSADGNTAIVGSTNGAWVFTRSGGVWTQEGPKFEATDAVGTAGLGSSVALSSDGNTAIVGGSNDNNDVGAAWVFTRSSGVWTQQGAKLVGSGAVGAALQGRSAAVSADGNTAIIGGYRDNNDIGAAWVFTRSAGVWTQQGPKLVGSGVVGIAQQGVAVAMSADGNTAIVGGNEDNNIVGAAWIFTRSAGVWTQQGSKLVGSGVVGIAQQGVAVALSADSNIAVVGGFNDNNARGAAWIFRRLAPSSQATHDFDGNGQSDIAWRNTSTGSTAIWLMNGAAIASSGSLGTVSPEWSVVGQRDFDGDGKYDLLWRESTTGTVAIWFLNGTAFSSAANLGAVPFATWTIVGTCDVNGDGKGDLIWRSDTGVVAVWLLDGGAVASSASFGTVETNWQIVGCADFEGDGKADLLWRESSSGALAIWFLDGAAVTSTANLGAVSIASWPAVGMQTGDFNGDGKSDILWRSDTGLLATWLMNGATVLSSATLGTVPLNWAVTETGDFDGDGTSDLLWREATGLTAMWFLSGTAVWSSATLGLVDTSWVVQNLNAN